MFWPEQPPDPEPHDHEQQQNVEIIAAAAHPEPDPGPVRRRAPLVDHPDDQGHPRQGHPNEQGHPGLSHPDEQGYPRLSHPNDQGHPQLGQPNHPRHPQSSSKVDAVEAPQPRDDSEPYGSQGYPFKDPVIVSLIQSDSRIGSNQEVQALGSEIVTRYDAMVDLREGVRGSLREFKAALRLQQTTELTACFHALKSEAGRRSVINIVQEDRDWRLDVDEITLGELSEQTQRAVAQFNNLLKNAYDFLTRKQESLDFIRGKLAQMKERRQYQVSYKQYDQVKDTPTEICKLAEEIEQFLHDMNIAKRQLKSKAVTGQLAVAHDLN